MKKIVKNLACALFVQATLVSCMDLDEHIYDKLPTDQFGNAPLVTVLRILLLLKLPSEPIFTAMW